MKFRHRSKRRSHVIRNIRRNPDFPTRDKFLGNQAKVFRICEPPSVVFLLRPGIWIKKVAPAQAGRGQHVKKIAGISWVNAQVSPPLDPGQRHCYAIHEGFASDEIHIWHIFRQTGQVFAAAKSDLQHDVRVSAEEHRNIQMRARRVFVPADPGNPEPRKRLFQVALLTFAQGFAMPAAIKVTPGRSILPLRNIFV